ncbi:MAG: transglutaminase domain-containing protein [Oscillospiraceae bacterium]
MLKKTVLLLLCAVLLFTTGCSALIEGEYSDSSKHTSSTPLSSQEAEMSAEVSTYTGLYEAIRSFVEAGIEHGTVRFDTYNGDIDSDLAEICLAVSSETPLGAYAVYYINYSLNKIVSYYEAEITVIYKKTQEEISQIIELAGTDDIYEYIKDILAQRTTTAAFLLEQNQITEEMLESTIDSVYYGNPDLVLYYPKYSVSYYPENSYRGILEINLSFPYTDNTAGKRRDELIAEAERIAQSIEGETVQEKVASLCSYLGGNVVYDEARANSDNYSRWYNSFTAYGAIILGKAVGEGYAMAMKLLCNELGIECVVIRGRLNNINHAWNLVKLESGEYYHVDSSRFDAESGLFFNDSQMQEEYWWDPMSYPECAGTEFVEENTLPASIEGDGVAHASQGEPSGTEGTSEGEVPPEEPAVTSPDGTGEPENPAGDAGE